MTIRRRNVRMALAVLCVGGALAIGSPVAPAQESAEKAAAEKKAPVTRISLLDTLKKGGKIGWTIVLLSVVAMALAAEHAISIRQARLMPMATVLQIKTLLKKRSIDELREFCGHDNSFVAKVIGAGVAEPRSSYEEVEAAMMEAGSEETAKLYRKIEYLSLIANISTMLGLLGTVAGMIQSFDTIAKTGGFAKPAELAGGIAMALITTYEGLVVAIPALVVYVYFRNRIEELAGEVANVSEELMLPVRRRAMRDADEDEE